MSTLASGTASRPGGLDPVAQRLEQHRAELTGYCYRMLGSPFEAEDAVQETLTRAWRGYARFKGQSSLRTWLYRIASNVCFDLLGASQRRALPIDVSSAVPGDGPAGEILPEATWIQPVPDGVVVAADGDPAQVAAARETIRLAFVAALQHLPPKQRAVLILREALRWEASEVAALLETTVPSVNSALQRARATLGAHDIDVGDQQPASLDAAQRDLLDRYVDAFERYDMDALTAVIRADARQSMPPYAMWLRGRDDILRWWSGPGAACRGSRLVPTRANGRPAFGQYRPSGPGGRHEPWSLQVLEIEGSEIVEMTFFLDTKTLFPLFGLPERLD